MNVPFSWKVYLLLLWWPLLMSSKQDCKWLPVLDRPLTLVSLTASGRYSGKKGPQPSGKGLQVGAVPTWSGLTGLRVLLPFFIVWLFFSHPGAKCHTPSSPLLCSSSVSIFSPVWCHFGHLWTSSAVVLPWFWRPVSTVIQFFSKESTHSLYSLHRPLGNSYRISHLQYAVILGSCCIGRANVVRGITQYWTITCMKFRKAESLTCMKIMGFCGEVWRFGPNLVVRLIPASELKDH